MSPMTICTDSRPCTQVTADPGRHRIDLAHVDRDAMKVCEYVRRGRVEARWIPTDRNWADISYIHQAPSHWRRTSFTPSGNRCVDTSHGRCLMRQLRLLGLFRSNSHAGNKKIQRHRHCKEWGGERSEPATPPHSPAGGAHANVHLKFEGMCAAKTERVNPHQQPDKLLASGQEVRLSRRVGAPSGRCPE